jgi:hypothetical protein
VQVPRLATSGWITGALRPAIGPAVTPPHGHPNHLSTLRWAAITPWRVFAPSAPARGAPKRSSRRGAHLPAADTRASRPRGPACAAGGASDALTRWRDNRRQQLQLSTTPENLPPRSMRWRRERGPMRAPDARRDIPEPNGDFPGLERAAPRHRLCPGDRCRRHGDPCAVLRRLDVCGIRGRPTRLRAQWKGCACASRK